MVPPLLDRFGEVVARREMEEDLGYGGEDPGPAGTA